MDPDPIKIVSWNIMHGLRVDEAIEVLRSEPRLADLDLLLLQEMDRPGTELVASALGLHHVYAAGGAHAKSGRDFGNAILSTSPLGDESIVDLPHQARVGGHPRVAVTAVTKLQGEMVTVCSTHTEIPAMSAARRQAQFAALASVAAAWPTDRAILGGDFNTVTSRGVRALRRALELADLDHVSVEAITTLRRGGQDFTLDHIFARGLRPIESGVVRGLAVSDHAPIWVSLEPWSGDGQLDFGEGHDDGPVR